MRFCPCRSSAFASLLALTIPAGVAQADWTVTNLQPTGAAESEVMGGVPGQQVGYSGFARGTPSLSATLWTGSAASRVYLNPTGATYSIARSTRNGQQAGLAFFSGATHAGTWSGSAASWQDLHPAGATSSEALATSGAQQVGYAAINFTEHAALWSGDAASWVDLSPAGFSGPSRATAINGSRQAGYVGNPSINSRAVMWSGSAASMIDLNPAGATRSQVLAMTATQQGGTADLGDFITRAGLWNGTASSWVSLHPQGAGASGVFAMTEGYQVGSVSVAVSHAALWTGDAASFVDLHMLLTGSWRDSLARSVWTDNNTVYVGGAGFNNATQRYEALVWSRPIPTPGAAGLLAMGGALAARRRRLGR